MDKAALRKEYKNKRKALSSELKLEIEEQIFHHLIGWRKISELKNFHIFLSSSRLREVDTSKIIGELQKLGKKIIVPKVQGNTMLSCEVSESTKFETSSWGISEPVECPLFLESQIDVVITPLLICDTQGNRIGYGGGFYDKLFAQCPQAIKVGVNFFSPVENTFETYPTDIPLDYLITQEGVVRF